MPCSSSGGRGATTLLHLVSAHRHRVYLPEQFLESGEDNIQVVLTWMDGWYKGDEDNAIIDTDVFIENAKKFGSYCGKNPTASIVTAADEVLGK